jgi:hypothetical protein
MSATPTSLRLRLTDLACVLALTALATSPLLEAYGGWRWLLATTAGALVGLVVAEVSHRAGWGPWLTALALTVGYLVLGPALATPELATAGVLPGPESLRALLTGVVGAWRDSLTLITPLGSTGTVLVVPWILGLVTGLGAGSFLWRSRRPGAVAFVLILAFLVAAAFGDRATGATLARGLALAIGLLVWTRWRDTRDARVSWTRRLGLTAAVIAVAGGLAGGATLALASDQREVLRDHVDPPFDPLDYPSPLSRYRAYYDEATLGDATMFRTEGLATGDRIRIATMDTFDGIVWNVAGGPQAPTQSGTFGRLAPQPESGDEQQVSITIEDYSGPWVPTVGETRQVDVTRDGERDDSSAARVLYNRTTGTMAQLGGVAAGTTYTFRVVRPEVPASPEALSAGGGALPGAPDDVPVLTKKVQEWMAEAGSPSGGAAAQALVEALRKGFYSDGKTGEATSPSGHGTKRITDLVGADQMIGNDEQYASTMGVAAQLQGLPTRVVIGFVVPDSTGVVKGADVHAWVEVHLEGAGWVAFAPTPDKDRTPQQQQDDPEPQPQPNVVQPPVVPTEPDDDDKKAPQGAGKKVEDPPFEALGDVLRWVGLGAAAVTATSPLWGMLLVKRLRRRRRRTGGAPVDRISGGWREVTDRARDLGMSLPHSNTRLETSQVLAERSPESGVLALARRADFHVFGPSAPSDDEVRAYWKDVDSALSRMRRSAPWWRRPVAVLSPASIAWRPALRRLLLLPFRPLTAGARGLRSLAGRLVRRRSRHTAPSHSQVTR